MRCTFFVVLGVLFGTAVTAVAQTPVDCSLLTKVQAQGQNCLQTNAPIPDDELFQALEECRGVTPYDPRTETCFEKLAEIKRKLRPTATRTVPFALNEIWYEGAYSSISWRVLGLTVGTDGVEVVTLERVGELNNVRAFRNVPFEANRQSQWQKLQ